ncbi:MAG: P-loop NTPase fold protein [Burkholderiaceae bacterium]|nr:P-loop NTPase fold protein [Polaromonas sp.]MDO8767200.1 P-loop NTPase fold protein [Burkholderiaceae bacterium]
MNHPVTAVRIKRHVVPIGNTAFEGDLFDRRKLADRLTKSIELLRDGGAIAIDSPWGSGKTWFAKNWKLDLEQNRGFEAIYIDAFALDYVDDPFLMIAGELLAVARKKQPDKARSLLEASSRLGKAILPMSAKVVTGIASKWLVGESAAEGLGEALEEAVEGVGGLLEKQIEKKLEAYESEKQSAAVYRNLLENLAVSLTNPIVVFVDELDRCRPDFAVKTIERIKHFFEVPGVVFVLLVNRPQLCASIRGAYGADLDADAYLRKFLLFSLHLPKLSANSYDDFNIVYCKAILSAYGISNSKAGTNFAEQFGAVSSALGLEFRDLERGVALYALAGPINNSSPLVAWVIALKMWKPDIYARLAKGEARAHADVVELSKENRFGESYVVTHALNLHRSYAENFKTPLPRDSAEHLHHMTGNVSMDRAFPWIFSKIDLSVT